MENRPQHQGFYSADSGWDTQGAGGYSFDMGTTDFGADPQFATFDYSGNYPQPAQHQGVPVQSGYVEPNPYMGNSGSYRGSILTPETPPPPYNANGDSFEDEPPLLEELGINFDHIMQKTVAVINPFKQTDAHIMHDTDLAGPLVFCLAFGAFLLLSGKVHFGYIYGIGAMGCLAMYALLTLMSTSGISFGCTVSILGYCLLPMVLLSGFSILFSLKGTVGNLLAVGIVLWCALSASKLFVTALDLDHQQPLVAYPCALLYGVFALLTVF